MAITLYWKHADAITVHTSMVEFVIDYQDVIDNRGLEVGYLPDDEAATLIAEEGSAFEPYFPWPPTLHRPVAWQATPTFTETS